MLAFDASLVAWVFMRLPSRLISAFLVVAGSVCLVSAQSRDPFADNYEISVLQTLIDSFRGDSEIGRNPVLLLGEYSWYRCSRDEAVALSNRQFAGCPVQVRELVRESFAAKHTLTRLPRLEGVRILSESERKAWSPKTSLERFGQRGYSELGKPVFNSDRTLALVYVSYYCGGLCASETFYVFTRHDDQWRQTCQIALRDV